MPSISQLNANRENAIYSTGPRTASGKAVSSLNHLTLGLYTRQDYVKPEERELYKDFCETMFAELAPESLLEKSLAAEITGASWRLRRCSAAEAELADYALTDPLLDETKEKSLRSIERARASAHSLLHRSINQLRKLQTEREIRFELSDGEITGLAVPRKPAVPKKTVLPKEPDPLKALRDAADKQSDAVMAQIMAYCAVDPSIANETWEEYVARTQPESAQAHPAPEETNELASNCEQAPQTPRNAQCPCKSGEKYKRCCGKNAPPVLNRAA